MCGVLFYLLTGNHFAGFSAFPDKSEKQCWCPIGLIKVVSRTSVEAFTGRNENNDTVTNQSFRVQTGTTIHSENLTHTIDHEHSSCPCK